MAGCGPATWAAWTATGCCASPTAAKTSSSPGARTSTPRRSRRSCCEHPAVIDAAVVGQADATWGSVPVAVVVVAPGASVGDAELERHCRERLAAYKVPVRFHRLPALPRNEAGKVLRRELRELLAEAPA